MTVDAAGDLWVAIYGGGRVHRYSPDGALRQAIIVPAQQTTCCGFAGPGLNSLYVTTATENWSDHERRAEPAAGLVLLVHHRCDRPADDAVPPGPQLVAEGDLVTMAYHRTALSRVALVARTSRPPSRTGSHNGSHRRNRFRRQRTPGARDSQPLRRQHSRSPR